MKTLVFVDVFFCADLVERKRVSAEKRAVEERERQKTMELEEAFRDNAKTRGLPREVHVHVHVYLHVHVHCTLYTSISPRMNEKGGWGDLAGAECGIASGGLVQVLHVHTPCI